ncbi:hypothetical protein V6N12_036910 [Hibiscus sabdariffa]|uniref:Uncharacterized protein n=1 Tax=Hibiscus sabdariffa TaxID=183260 RepID=A0ABR1ZYB6_9ROSI
MIAISGSFGGVMEACCLQPIDVIKTRLQLDRTASYKGILHCGSTVYRTEGLHALRHSLDAQVRLAHGFQRGVSGNRKDLVQSFCSAKVPYIVLEQSSTKRAGAAPTVMRNGTNQAAMFSAKNAFDVILWKKHEGDQTVLQPWQSMVSGFLAGTAGPVCTGPLDVVKTRLMRRRRVEV